MKGQTQQRWMRVCRLIGVCGVILLCVTMLGRTGWALASDSLVRLHVDSGRLTGQLTQVPLRAVLGQLHAQLGIDYVAPAGELEKVISVTLRKEPLSKALSMILAPWDYAFTFDAAGNVKTVYVIAKVSPETSLAVTMAKSGGVGNREDKAGELQGHTREDPKAEDQLNNKASKPDLPTRDRAGTNERVFASADVPMEIRPPAPGTSMPILPAKGTGMRVTPGGSAQVMEIIPPTAYPPMNIQPVSEHAQQEMLLTLKP